MGTIGKWTLAMALAGILSAPVLAQQGRERGPFRGGFGPAAGAGLLMAPAVQKELKLSEEQVQKVRGLAEELRSSMGEKFREIRELPEDQRREKFQQVSREAEKNLREKLHGILDKDQGRRYRQISLQTQGARAFERPEVAKRLKLTDEQKQKIQAIQEGAREQFRTLFQGARDGDRQATMRKLREAQEKTLGEIQGVLNDDQKEAWKKMTGKPFHLGPGEFRRDRDSGNRRGPRDSNR